MGTCFVLTLSVGHRAGRRRPEVPSGCLVLQGQLERRREGDKGGGMGRRGRVDKEEEGRR